MNKNERKLETLFNSLDKHRALSRKLSDAQIIEWAKRHDVGGTLTDWRCMVEDAATLTPNAEVSRDD